MSRIKQELENISSSLDAMVTLPDIRKADRTDEVTSAKNKLISTLQVFIRLAISSDHGYLDYNNIDICLELMENTKIAIPKFSFYKSSESCLGDIIKAKYPHIQLAGKSQLLESDTLSRVDAVALLPIYKQLYILRHNTYTYKPNSEGKITNTAISVWQKELTNVDLDGKSAYVDYKRSHNLETLNREIAEKVTTPEGKVQIIISNEMLDEAIYNLVQKLTVDNKQLATSDLTNLVKFLNSRGGQNIDTLAESLVVKGVFTDTPCLPLKSKGAFSGWTIEKGELVKHFSVEIKALEIGNVPYTVDEEGNLVEFDIEDRSKKLNTMLSITATIGLEGTEKIIETEQGLKSKITFDTIQPVVRQLEVTRFTPALNLPKDKKQAIKSSKELDQLLHHKSSRSP